VHVANATGDADAAKPVIVRAAQTKARACLARHVVVTQAHRSAVLCRVKLQRAEQFGVLFHRNVRERETQRRAPRGVKHTNCPDRDVLQRDTCYQYSHGR
jgi:hypothetical protein